MTIAINLVFAKLTSGIMEKKISKWVEDKDKRDKGQACFHSKHSTIDHCTTLRHIVNTTWDNKGKDLWCCFFDLLKVFDIAQERNYGKGW